MTGVRQSYRPKHGECSQVLRNISLVQVEHMDDVLKWPGINAFNALLADWRNKGAMEGGNQVGKFIGVLRAKASMKSLPAFE